MEGTQNTQQQQGDKMVFTAYVPKTKEKNVTVQDPKIIKTGPNTYMVTGHDGKGNKMSKIIKSEDAMRAIETKSAIKGF